MLVLADVLALVCAFLILDLVRGVAVGGDALLPRQLPFLAGGIVAWIALAAANDLYHLRSRRLERDIGEETGSILRMTMWWSWAVLLAAEIVPLDSVTVPLVAMFWVTASVLLGLLRAAARGIASRRPWYRHRTLLIGVPWKTQALARKLERHPEYGIDVVGSMEVCAAAPARRDGEAPRVVSFEDVPDVVRELGVHRVILAGAPRGEGRAPRFDLARGLTELGVRVDLLPSWFEMLGARLEVSEIEGTSLLTVPYVRLGRSSRVSKRMFDVTVAGVILILMVPLFVACALAVKLDSKGPVLFRQRRVGRNGERFELLKFRSMHIGADEDKERVAHLNLHRAHHHGTMFKIRRDPRITRVGAFLRQTSLDEMPQIWNILRGDMSLVGPRPLIEEEAEQVEGLYRRRLELTPGLTGLWQVNGRSEVPFDAMVNLDYLYVTTWSLWGDTKILLKTVPAVFAGRGAF